MVLLEMLMAGRGDSRALFGMRETVLQFVLEVREVVEKEGSFAITKIVGNTNWEPLGKEEATMRGEFPVSNRIETETENESAK